MNDVWNVGPLAATAADAEWLREHGFDQPAPDDPYSRASPGPVKHRGQMHMAERFTADHAEHLRHVHGIGWYLWAGSHWRQDDDRADMRAVMATVKKALRQLNVLDKDERDDLYKDLRRAESASAAEGVLRLAAAMHPMSVASRTLDAEPYLFNTPGETIDLRDGTRRPNDRRDLITKVSGATVGEAHDGQWSRFLATILPDPDVRAFVRRIFGYAMLGKVTEHVMIIFTGTGANGKGTLRDAVMAAFGDYAIEVDPALLMESKHERHGTFKMRLRGSRLVFCSETEKGRRFAEATMKRLVGGDPIEANLMHRDPITFDPSHTLVMLTNHLPAVSGDDPAVWRRILVVPFDVVIPENNRDPELPRRLRECAPEIMAWAYQGWVEYQRVGLHAPEVVRAKTLAYRAESDVLGRFLGERTIPTPAAYEGARDLFTAWSKWCRASGEEAGSEVAFSSSMLARGFERKRTARGFSYRGLMLASEEDEEP